MLDRFKNRVSNFFTEEVPAETKEESNHQTQPFQAKVTYQYPTKSPFRFPVIPDDEERRDPLDIPAYRRRKRERQQDELPDMSEEKVIETSKPKFVPSQVPSPIYGYQKYKPKKEIENIPAFIRKQELETFESEQPEQVKQQQDHDSVDRSKNSEEPVTTKNEINIEKTIGENKVKQDIVPDQSNEHSQSSNLLNKQVGQAKRSQYKNRRKKKFNNTQKSSEASPIPFNVMMSANDKQHLQNKRNTNKTKIEKRHQPSPSKEPYEVFPSHLLNDPEIKTNEDRIWVQDQQELLEETLKHFNVKAKVVNATQGPSVTRFEVQPELGVKVSRVRNLNDDIKLNMSAKDIRIEAPIPGKNTIGIEIPNLKPQMVGLQEIFETSAFQQSKSPLTIGLGLNVEGDPLVTNISKMPHGLIAGATGSGKSVCINTILISLLYKSSHKDVKFLLIDPKMVELAPYNAIPHLVAPVITDVKAATAALKWAVNEMEERYDKFVHQGVRDINRYNDKMIKENKQEEKMPFMVIVIDELADLMMASPQDVEDSIARIAQKARACGIHLLLATQRPSVDVITGLIKANIPTRIAFSVSSQVDSRTIIDTNGAERLLGKGDMLFVENGSGKSVRLQGAFVSDEEIERVTNHARTIASPNYLFEQEQLLLQIETDEEEDELLEEVIAFVIQHNQASTSLLQRQFRIGYNRAARLIDHLESKGIISGQNGSKPREILLASSQLEEML